MNISPDLYPTAKKINQYLYYAAEAGDSFSEMMGIYSRPYSPGDRDESVISEALEYQRASEIIWISIENLYPGFEPYRVEASASPFSTNEDPHFKWPYDPSQPLYHGGLW
jgi:hypothetical protein